MSHTLVVPFSPFFKNSLSISPDRFTFFIKRLTPVKTSHHYIVHFLVPFYSSSNRMTLWSPLLCRGTPAGREAFSGRSSHIHAVILRILSTHLVNFRSHHHRTTFCLTSNLRRPHQKQLLPPAQILGSLRCSGLFTTSTDSLVH